jgi:hypothetical protein
VYEVTEDGTLVYGGDVALRCEDLTELGAPHGPEPLTRQAMRACSDAGFPPPHPAPTDDTKPDGDSLPDTGGPAHLLAAGVALSILGILGLGGTHRRYTRTSENVTSTTLDE